MPARPHQLPPTVPVSGAPLDQARAAFAWLTLGPGPVTLDGRSVPGLPARPVPIDEVRDRLAHPACPPVLSDAVWAHLVRGARARGGTATVMCVGCALPALDRVSRRFQRGLRPDPARRGVRAGRRQHGHAVLVADVESAVLSGFLTELAVTDLRSPGVAGRLVSAAYEAGRRACREYTGAPLPQPKLFRSCPPPPPARHPDLVLARAVAAGAVTRGEAVLIGSTRLEPISLDAIARARGRSVREVRAARVRAERKLAAYLRDDHPGDIALVVASAPHSDRHTPQGGAAPRQARGSTGREAAVRDGGPTARRRGESERTGGRRAGGGTAPGAATARRSSRDGGRGGDRAQRPGHTTAETPDLAATDQRSTEPVVAVGRSVPGHGGVERMADPSAGSVRAVSGGADSPEVGAPPSGEFRRRRTRPARARSSQLRRTAGTAIPPSTPVAGFVQGAEPGPSAGDPSGGPS